MAPARPAYAATWPKPAYEAPPSLHLDPPLRSSSSPFELLVNCIIYASHAALGAVGYPESSAPYIVAGVFAAAIAGGVIVALRNVAKLAAHSLAPETPPARPAEDDPAAKRRPRKTTRLPSLYHGVALPLASSFILISLAFSVLPALVDRSMNRVLPLPEADRPAPESIAFHDSLPFIGDLHADSLMWSHRGSFLDPSLPSFAQVSAPLLRKGNVALQVLSSVTRVPYGLNMELNSNQSGDTLDLLTFVQRWGRNTYTGGDERFINRQEMYSTLMGLATKYSDGKLIWIKNKADLARLLEERAKDKAVVGALLSTEGTAACVPEVLTPEDCAGKLYHLGIRMVGLTHFIDLAVGASATGTAKNGLTPYGRRFVKRLFDLGILVDFAHVHSTTIMDTLAIHDALPEPRPPMVVSHTGFRAICNISRNLDDETAREMVRRGTLLGVAFFPEAVCGDSVKDVVDNFRYAADMFGAGNVALGSDYDGAVAVPFGIGDLAVLTHGLLAYGSFTSDQVADIMGGNLLRVLREGLPE
ncbi:hypothetical protein DFJ74DRAFT_704587 [Hyaloraphidium curvatum]|nr:hypothetical protein DFJ74DRAFT_704587 [Hyaloraphidium curvatum]